MGIIEFAKMRICIYFLILLKSLVVLCASDANLELRSVVVITSNGAKNMLFPDFFQITTENKFKQHPGRLTKIGKRQHYLLGRELSFRYKNLLQNSHSSRDIYLQTTNLNCTIESAQSFLLGLYPPGTGSLLINEHRDKIRPPITVKELEKIQQELGYSAIRNFQRILPIYTSSEADDYYFAPHLTCKTFNEDDDRLADESDEVDIEFGSFLNAMKSYSHLFENIDWTADKCYKLKDSMNALKGNGQAFDFVLDQGAYERLKQCAMNSSFREFLGGELRPKLLTYRLLDDISEQFKNVMNDSVKAKKLSVYFTSDLHIMALFKAFSIVFNDSGWYIDDLVPFASSLVFEIYRNKDDPQDKTYVLKAQYNDIPLNLPADAQEFIDAIKEYTYENDTMFFKACTLSGREPYDSKLYTAVSVLLLMFLIAVLGTSWYLLLKSSNIEEEDSEEELIN